MKKKFICTVCGYIHEGDAAPEKCPLCGVPASKFEELKENEALSFVTEHVIGVAKDTDDEMKKDLNAHFAGECTEVGMYLAMSRQADREGYPEIAEAFRRYALEECRGPRRLEWLRQIPAVPRSESEKVRRQTEPPQRRWPPPASKWTAPPVWTVRAGRPGRG